MWWEPGEQTIGQLDGKDVLSIRERPRVGDHFLWLLVGCPRGEVRCGDE